MSKLLKYWKIGVVTFLTVDVPLELGGFGTVFHTSLSQDNGMAGFFISALATFFVLALAFLNSGGDN